MWRARRCDARLVAFDRSYGFSFDEVHGA